MRTANLTEPQSARRERMLAVALDLAARGGWDGVQMREVAAGAEVALGTLYRYFPSKEHLLVSMMLEQVQALAHRLAVKPPTGDDPVERVVNVLRRANRNLQRQPDVTRAMIRALVSGNTDVAPVVSAVRDEMARIIADALDGDSEVGSDALAIALLADVWLATLVSWISGTADAESNIDHLVNAAHVLLG